MSPALQASECFFSWVAGRGNTPLSPVARCVCCLPCSPRNASHPNDNPSWESGSEASEQSSLLLAVLQRLPCVFRLWPVAVHVLPLQPGILGVGSCYQPAYYGRCAVVGISGHEMALGVVCYPVAITVAGFRRCRGCASYPGSVTSRKGLDSHDGGGGWADGHSSLRSCPETLRTPLDMRPTSPVPPSCSLSRLWVSWPYTPVGPSRS